MRAFTVNRFARRVVRINGIKRSYYCPVRRLAWCTHIPHRIPLPPQTRTETRPATFAAAATRKEAGKLFRREWRWGGSSATWKRNRSVIGRRACAAHMCGRDTCMDMWHVYALVDCETATIKGKQMTKD